MPEKNHVASIRLDVPIELYARAEIRAQETKCKVDDVILDAMKECLDRGFIKDDIRDIQEQLGELRRYFRRVNGGEQ